MSGYRFGQTRTHELHDAIRRAEQAERLLAAQAVELDIARYRLRHRPATERWTQETYLSTLTPEQRRARPALRDGDTPEACRHRLLAATEEAWPIKGRQQAATA